MLRHETSEKCQTDLAQGAVTRNACREREVSLAAIRYSGRAWKRRFTPPPQGPSERDVTSSDSDSFKIANSFIPNHQPSTMLRTQAHPTLRMAMGRPAALAPIMASSSRGFSSSAIRSVPDHYAALNLPKNASRTQIKAKFYEVSHSALRYESPCR